MTCILYNYNMVTWGSLFGKTMELTARVEQPEDEHGRHLLLPKDENQALCKQHGEIPTYKLPVPLERAVRIENGRKGIRIHVQEIPGFIDATEALNADLQKLEWIEVVRGRAGFVVTNTSAHEKEKPKETVAKPKKRTLTEDERAAFEAARTGNKVAEGLPDNSTGAAQQGLANYYTASKPGKD